MKPLPNNTWYALQVTEPKAKDAAASEAELFIYDEIGGWGVHANDLISDLKAMPDSVETLHLRINSPGGSVIQGNVIYNALKREGEKRLIVTHIDGMAASMASVIALAGDEVHMAANALYMIHNPWTMAMGEAEDLRKQADLLDKIKATILNAYSRSTYDNETLSSLMDAETWFTAEEAMDAGFVDVVDGALEAAAKALDFDMVKDFNIPADYALVTEAPEPELPTAYDALAAQHKELICESADLVATIAEKDDLIKTQETELEELHNKHESALSDLQARHKADLEAAREITTQAVSAKAAELCAAQGVPPISGEPEDEGAPVEAKSILEKYEALKGPERTAFYIENKDAIWREKRAANRKENSQAS